MIDEDRTMEKYGYCSTDLKPRSNKPIVAICDDCGKCRILPKDAYSCLCRACSNKGERNPLFGKHHTAQSRKKMSESHKGKPLTEEHKRNMSKAQNGRRHTKATKIKMSESAIGKKKPPCTDEHRQHMSAGHQGIPYEDWTEFVSNGAYCEKFDEACRERIRAKYDRKCFLCNKPETDNKRKLSVHHYDMNKDAGCNGNKWKLVPLCGGCHNKVHSKMWQARIEYLLAYVWE